MNYYSAKTLAGLLRENLKLSLTGNYHVFNPATADAHVEIGHYLYHVRIFSQWFIFFREPLNRLSTD